MNIRWFLDRWEKVAAVIAAIVGVVLAVIGWVGASGASLATEQIPYLASGAVGSLFALGVSATLWLSADLRDEFSKLDEIFAWMRGEPATATEEEAAGWAAPGPEASIMAPAGRRRGRQASTLSAP